MVIAGPPGEATSQAPMGSDRAPFPAPRAGDAWEEEGVGEGWRQKSSQPQAGERLGQRRGREGLLVTRTSWAALRQS